MCSLSGRVWGPGSRPHRRLLPTRRAPSTQAQTTRPPVPPPPLLRQCTLMRAADSPTPLELQRRASPRPSKVCGCARAVTSTCVWCSCRRAVPPRGARRRAPCWVQGVRRSATAAPAPPSGGNWCALPCRARTSLFLKPAAATTASTELSALAPLDAYVAQHRALVATVRSMCVV